MGIDRGVGEWGIGFGLGLGVGKIENGAQIMDRHMTGHCLRTCTVVTF